MRRTSSLAALAAIASLTLTGCVILPAVVPGATAEPPAPVEVAPEPPTPEPVETTTPAEPVETVAEPDEDAFMEAVSRTPNAGDLFDDPEIREKVIGLGHMVCGLIEAGYSTEHIIERMHESSDGIALDYFSVVVAEAAEEHLCV